VIRRDAASARRSIPMIVVLQVNAVVALVVGVVLLAATWSSLFEHLSKFRPVPWIYAQIAGAAFVGLAWMLWTAARQPAMRTPVAQGAAIVNLVSFVCISVWVFSNDRGIPSSGSLGSWAFDVTAVLLATLGVLEARVWWRRAG
jgi:glucan phosphoethanolaminetransferase (alkaline phosphatase superfamily)